jgi:1-acyl-sn-glycerol-3-phosphate acyltransferase
MDMPAARFRDLPVASKQTWLGLKLMNLIARLRLLAGLSVGAIFMVIDIVHMILLDRILWLRGASPSERRIARSSLNSRWALGLIRVGFGVVGCRVDWSGCLTTIPDRETILIANHTGSIDLILLAAYLHWMYLQGGPKPNTAWIAKTAVTKYPLMGQILQLIGAIPITRNQPKKDFETIENSSREFAKEKTKIILFPEGTRWMAEKCSDGYKNVLKPKRGGFQAARKGAQGAQVLAVLFNWEKGATGMKTIWHMHSMCGKNLKMSSTLHEADEIDADPDWLERKFRQWDEQLEPER